jgi:predicted transcriptional regulator
MAALDKGRRITGAERETLTNELTARYTNGASIRELAADTGRSYGFIHRLLVESGVHIRGRGGPTRSKKNT